ncbi:ATP-dependent RecD-like DNA helicase [Candidatus Dependentiae bacterium Noda2021]|nr:ATP-dependent RecD-like DNA helicase [Candidatus Dependentiae bacterium Noda2021]
MNQEQINGTVERLLFTQTDTGYYVFTLALNAKTEVVVRGYLPTITQGQQVSVTGNWVTHPKFGKQFEAQHAVVQLPTTLVGLKKYLGSGLIKGIGPSYAEKLINTFGSSILEIIDKTPEKLSRVEGIGAKRIESIVEAWKDQKEISQLMIFLQEKGISPGFATKIYKTYRHNSFSILQENPYRIAEDIWGVGFKMADTLAQSIGIPANSPKRIKAALVHVVSTELTNGHVYVELSALKLKTAELLEQELIALDPIIKLALHDLYSSEKIKLVSCNKGHFLTLTAHYVAEYGIAQKIKNLKEQPSLRAVDVDRVYSSLRDSSADKVHLNDDQQRGILTCLQHKITIITGGPGTGKTTLIKKLLAILDEEKFVYRLAAPTGRAAKRITQGTGKHAVTLHRLLEFDFNTRSFTHTEHNALKLDFLIIDEASMIDIFLGYSILKALPFHAHIVFIGDIDQLPSVGAGNFLNDLIASNAIACVRLHEIFRQSQDSLIIVNAHRVNEGEFPVSFLPDAKRDFVYIKEDDPTMVADHLKTIYSKKLAAYGIAPDDAMVLVPMNKGTVGTQSINGTLQELLNTNPGVQIVHHGTRFGLHDRVMQIKNNYDKHVFNGDIGTIHEVNTSDRSLVVQFSEKLVTYESSDLDELVLAYAISIHKSQGSEYSAVVICLFMQHFTLLARNLLYTAITRAKKLCIIIGQAKAIGMSVTNNKQTLRTTFLKEYLTSDLQCR